MAAQDVKAAAIPSTTENDWVEKLKVQQIPCWVSCCLLEALVM